MSIFFRYLLSLAMNMAWQRAGRGGAIPPVRLPGKGKQPVNLPMIGPWQMMLATWIIKRVWARHGTTIKNHLQNNANDLTRRAAKYIPDPKTSGANANANAAAGSANATSSTRSAPTIAPTPTPVPTPRPAPNFNTQVLGGAPNNAPSPNAPSPNAPPSNAPQNPLPQGSLPQGSILGKLRGRS